jgi:hypothetical protein
VGKRTEPLLDGPDGTFNFTNVALGGNNVEMNGGKGGLDAGEFMVPMDVGDLETPDGIQVEYARKFLGDGGGVAVGYGDSRTETNVTRDGMKETLLLDKKNPHRE